MGPYGVILNTWGHVQGDPEVIGIFLNRERAEAWASTLTLANLTGVLPWGGAEVVAYVPLDHLAEGVSYHIFEDLWGSAWETSKPFDNEYHRNRKERLKTLWETWKGMGLVEGSPWQI